MFSRMRVSHNTSECVAKHHEPISKHVNRMSEPAVPLVLSSVTMATTCHQRRIFHFLFSEIIRDYHYAASTSDKSVAENRTDS